MQRIQKLKGVELFQFSCGLTDFANLFHVAVLKSGQNSGRVCTYQHLVDTGNTSLLLALIEILLNIAKVHPVDMLGQRRDLELKGSWLN